MPSLAGTEGWGDLADMGGLGRFGVMLGGGVLRCGGSLAKIVEFFRAERCDLKFLKHKGL